MLSHGSRQFPSWLIFDVGQNMNLDSLPWTVTQARNDAGSVVVFRHRKFSADFAKSSFPHRLNVFWTSGASTESGLPDESDSKAMGTFEDRLVDATESDEQSVLSLVVTGKNQREWVFHTKSTEEFLRRLTAMPQERDPYPIEIHPTPDSEWEYVDRVIGDIVAPPEKPAPRGLFGRIFRKR
jgi:hypothetical protein